MEKKQRDHRVESPKLYKKALDILKISPGKRKRLETIVKRGEMKEIDPPESDKKGVPSMKRIVTWIVLTGLGSMPLL